MNRRIEILSKKHYVKFMVSLRCKLIVREELDKLNIKYSTTVHGAIVFREAITQYRLNELNQNLQRSGLELLDRANSQLIDKIIHTIIEVVHYSDELPKIDFTDVISEHFASETDCILKLFSQVKGMSVSQFIVAQKVERIKELLLYEELTLGDIANKLNYKNEGLMIAQFKKYTGLTPAFVRDFKNGRTSAVKAKRLTKAPTG